MKRGSSGAAFRIASAAAFLLTVAAPASSGTGDCRWVTSHAPIAKRVDQLMAVMTLDQKLQLLHGLSPSAPPSSYAGYVTGIPSLCIPDLKLEDGPDGVGDGMTGVTQLPAPVTVAASWDTGLAALYGTVIGTEEAGKGATINLGPTVNIVRDPRWGRAFETYGEDPYLSGQIAAAYINGVQSTGTMAMLKHFAVYNQETYRVTIADDAEIDQRTMQEIYLPQFGTAVQLADPAAVLCAYPFINGISACQNAYTLKDVLRKQWKYDGFVSSDWYATYTVLDANAGLDLQMPYDTVFGAPLTQAVMDGTVTIATIDSMVKPILTEMFRFKLFTRPPTGEPSAIVTTPQHAALAREVAEQGAVLLKNSTGLLPLPAGRSLAVIGEAAGLDLSDNQMDGSAYVAAPYLVTPYEGIVARAGSSASVQYAQGDALSGVVLTTVPTQYLTPRVGSGTGLTGEYFTNMTLSGAPALTQNSSQIDFVWNDSPISGIPATNWSARWTGTITVPTTATYPFSITSDDGSRLFINGQEIIDNWYDGASHTGSGTAFLQADQPVPIEVDYYQNSGGSSLSLGWQPTIESLRQEAVDLAKSSDAAIVFVAKPEMEGLDLADIDLQPDANDLIAAVAAANPNTIVVLNSGSAVTMPWIAQVNSVLEAWYPGQENGNAIAALLFGDVNPSGKLPVTFPKSLDDVPAATPSQWPGVGGMVEYSEGLEVGYRWYDAKQIEPLFSFGHGLSYTNFAFSKLRVRRPGPRSAVVSVDVTNTGAVAGSEVAQVYIGDPQTAGEPPEQLKAFQKVALNPGQTKRLSFNLGPDAFSIWDVRQGRWRITAGQYGVFVGDSSDNLPLRATVRFAGSG